MKSSIFFKKETAPKAMPSKTFIGLVNLVSGRSTLENQIFYVVTRTAQQKMTFWLRRRFSTESTSKMHNALSSNAISYNIKVYQILLAIGKVSTPPFRVCTLKYTGEKVSRTSLFARVIGGSVKG
ncbi:hypothetical protein BOTCAL_0037g00060 [Botryotinia calthae]|uniref:Uncharacterized protein n=1 Tax=Botryotinia calthae TaxID=38488 RepID=A0A4Y8DET7_9HELO|nr:hypothetical protein BOTCAL_0037g00060 [Botryotinia calthae]